MKKSYSSIVEWLKKVPGVLDDIRSDIGTVKTAVLDAKVHMDAINEACYQSKVTPKDIVESPMLISGFDGIILNFEGNDYVIYGGRYIDKPVGMLGVKMAVEVKMPCFIDIPTIDFQVPDQDVMELNLWKALVALKAHKCIYAGCQGGIGRTGLFMALMMKVSWTMAEESTMSTDRITKAIIKKVRDEYHPHALETEEQERYIANFNVTVLCDLVSKSGLFS